MRVRLPKSFNLLPLSEKNIINDMMTQEVEKQTNHNMAELQKIWLQFACIVLHRNFDFTKDDCMLFLADWHNVYRINKRLKTKAEQAEYLAREIDEIFQGSYPTEFIDKMEEI